MTNLFRNMMVFGVGAFALVYLLNPTAGFIEFIPDAIPLIGNLDEATATALLLGSMRYFGVDPMRLFSRNDDASEKTTVSGTARAK